MNRRILSSKKSDWGTPEGLFRRCSELFGPFDLDPCAMPFNAKCARYFTPFENGLWQPWRAECVFLNPPYGAEVKRWLAKARAEVMAGNAGKVVALIASRTGAQWWHEHVLLPGNTVHYVKGRVTFEGAEACAMFDSAIVVFTAGGEPVRHESFYQEAWA